MRALAVVGFCLATSATNAAFISVEPDDFAPLSTITSPSISVSAVQNFERFPVYASLPPNSHAAPTGSSMFTSNVDGSVHGWAAVEREGRPWYGLLFEFSEPVAQVSLHALNIGYPGLGIDCIAWAGTNVSGCQGSNRYESLEIGQPFVYELDFSGAAINQLLVGGGNTIAAIGFDRIEARPIPVPATFALMLLGLLGAAVTRRSR